MSESMFDADSILSAVVTGALSTSREPLPAMEEATLVIKSLKPRVTPKGSPLFEITCVVDEQVAREVTGMDEPTVRYTCWLDLTEAGDLDMTKGRNIDLGRIRAATNQNDPTIAWSPAMLEGAVMVGSITQRPDDNDPTKIYNDVGTIRAV